jgi:hypothetical protein
MAFWTVTNELGRIQYEHRLNTQLSIYMKLLLIEAYDILTSNKSVEYNMNTGINSYVTITNRNIQRSDQQQIISLVEYNMNLQSIYI